MRYFYSIMIVLIFSGCVPEPEAPIQKQKCVSSTELNGYSYDYLSRVAKTLREDKKNIESFEGFVNIMKNSVDEYATMVKSSVYISNVVRFLPIPYAGEVSSSAKLVSKTVLNLGGAASSLNKYKKSSSAFLDAFDKINRSTVSASELSKLAVYADTQVLSDARNLQNTLETISDSTSALSAATQGIADALEMSGSYMNQAKSLVGLSPANDDKAKVAQSHDSINARMIQLNQKIASLEKSGEFNRYNIEKARIYSELSTQLENR